jgi:hypothetical protein
LNLESIQDEQCLHGGVADALVAIEKRVIQYQGKTQGSRLLKESRIEILAAEAHSGLCDSGFQGTEVSDTMDSSSGFNDEPMQLCHLGQAEMAHQLRRSYSSRFFLST